MIHPILALRRSFYSIILRLPVLITCLNFLKRGLIIIYYHIELNLILIICHVNIKLIHHLMISLNYLIYILIVWVFNLIIFNLILMVKLNLSKPFINGLIIFLNDTLYHPFSIKLLLIYLKILFICYIFHLCFLNLKRKTIIILVLVTQA